MSLAERPTADDRLLPSWLGRVRRRIRAYVAVEGLAATVAALGIGFWAALGLDWFFEPSSAVRLALVGLVVLATVVVFYRKFLARVFARLSDRSLALVAERRFRDLKDSLLTAIEVDPATLSDYGRSLWIDTRSEARQHLATADVGRLFDPRPRRQAVAAAIVAAATVGGFAYAAPQLFRLGVDRLLARTDEAWPRRTRLSIDRFESGERVVPQGADVEIVVRADASMVVPSDVYLRYRTADGVRDEQVMDREGTARPGFDEHQQYKFTFRGVSSSMTFDVVGGDARLRGLKIRVVERPQVRLRLVCKYPSYIGRADGELDVTGPVPLPQGTLVTVVAAANKPLRSVVAALPDGRGAVAETNLALADSSTGAKDFRFEVGRLLVDTAVAFKLRDTDGIDNVAQLSLIVLVDQPPTVAVQRRGLEAVVTPQARLVFRGQAKDDFGLARLWFEYAVEGTEARRRPLAAKPQGERELAVDEGLELVEAFSGTPPTVGQTIVASVRAEDNRDLPEIGAGNVTAGDQVTLTVVTDAELLRLLEAREIMFREQFKALIDKVTRSRDGLVAVGAPVAAKSDEAEGVPKNRDAIVVEQTRTRVKEQRAETMLVADGFAAIVDELTNNRAANSDRLRERLADEIAAPLHDIGKRMFPEYEARLTKLHTLVGSSNADAAAVEPLRREAIESADAILVEMQAVLDKMQELESFKEAIDLLKTIIALQREVGERTKKSRQDKSRLE
jgi:hypothetical protein